jgi:hypothetical protein
MVVHFQYGNQIFLRSALKLLAERADGSREDLPAQFHKVADMCEARFRGRSVAGALEYVLSVARRRTELVVVDGPDLTPRPAYLGHGAYRLTVASAAGRPLSWRARAGDPPRTFPHLRLELIDENDGEALIFLYGCDADRPDADTAGYRVVTDPWRDYYTELGGLLAALLSGGLEPGPAEPEDLRFAELDELLDAVRPRY